MSRTKLIRRMLAEATEAGAEAIVIVQLPDGDIRLRHNIIGTSARMRLVQSVAEISLAGEKEKIAAIVSAQTLNHAAEMDRIISLKDLLVKQSRRRAKAMRKAALEGSEQILREVHNILGAKPEEGKPVQSPAAPGAPGTVPGENPQTSPQPQPGPVPGSSPESQPAQPVQQPNQPRQGKIDWSLLNEAISENDAARMAVMIYRAKEEGEEVRSQQEEHGTPLPRKEGSFEIQRPSEAEERQRLTGVGY